MGLNIKKVKTCDFDSYATIIAVVALNKSKDKKLEVNTDCWPHYIVSSISPAKMLLPRGWSYYKHVLTNKHNTTSGMYREVSIRNTKGDEWDVDAANTANQIEGKDFSTAVATRVLAALNGGKFLSPGHIGVKPRKQFATIDGWEVIESKSGLVVKCGKKVVNVSFT